MARNKILLTYVVRTVGLFGSEVKRKSICNFRNAYSARNGHEGWQASSKMSLEGINGMSGRAGSGAILK